MRKQPRRQHIAGPLDWRGPDMPVRDDPEKLIVQTSVYLLPLRHPTPVAKQAATLDLISGGRFVMGIGATIFAMLMALIVGYLFFGEAEDISIQFTVTAIFTAFFLSRPVSDLWRMVLSPYLSQYRLPPFSDKNARRLYIWASALATYDISVVLFATWVADFGLNYNVYAMVYGGLTMIGALGNVLMILFNARAISNAIRASLAGWAKTLSSR